MTAAVSIRPGPSLGRRSLPPLPPVRVLAWGGWIVTTSVVVTSSAVWAADGLPALPLSFARGPANVVSVALVSLAASTVGALLAWRHPRNAIGWLLLFEGLLTGLLTPVNLLVGQAFEAARMWPATTVAAAWLMSAFMTPAAVAAAILVLLVFPDGRFAGRRWWTAGAVSLAGAGLLALASAVDPSGLLWYPAVPNPTALPFAYDAAVGGLRLAGVALTVLALGLAAASVVVRYRNADGRLRLQLRWVVVGVAITGAAFVPFLVARYAMNVSETTSDVLLAVMAVGAACFPLAVAVAIVREHLYEIDAIIWRTLVYVPLMGLLAGLYAASVALFQRLFMSLTGNGSDAAIVISALILAGVFTPARQAVEARVSRRFKPAESTRRSGDGEPMPAWSTSSETLGAREPVAGADILRAPVAGADTSTDQTDRIDRTDRMEALEDRIAALEATLAAARQTGAAAASARRSDP